jgi:hypothetical protein
VFNFSIKKQIINALFVCSMTSSITISTDDLEKGQVNSQNETWIKPGKTFAVPVLVDRFNTTLQKRLTI